VASVLSQTMQDLELIVVDDGSTDGTAEALASVGDSRLRYVWQEQAGVAAARNAAAAVSRAPVLAFIDSDNRWLPDHLAVLMSVLDRHPRAVVASTCPDFLTVGRQRPGRSRSGDMLPELLMKPSVGFISCCAIRRQAFDTVGGFDETLLVLEDSDLFLRLAMVGDVARVRRRTMLRGEDRHGLQQSGRRNGAYLPAISRSAATAQVALARHRPDAPPAVVRAARARACWAEVETALETGDRDALTPALRRACELQPEVSSRPYYGAFRIRAHLTRTHERSEYMRIALDLAEAWPQPHADTPRYLRCEALALALRAASPRAARRALSGFGVRGLPGFALRVVPVFAYRQRRRWQNLRDRRRG
jgi:hypothetical protein